MVAEELDKALKIRTMRLLWTNGHFVRSNVPLYSIGGKFNNITDVDVLGISFNRDFSLRTTICDCKSGVNVSTPERIFWTSGVIKYFNADRGFFVRSKVLESKYVDLADRLNLLPISEKQLSTLEDAYNISKDYFIGAFREENLHLEKNRFRSLKEADSRSYHYIKIKYWIDPPNTQIISLMAYVKRINNNDKISDNTKFFLCLYILSLLSVSLINFSRTILVIPPTEREAQIKERLMGGRTENYERKKTFENFYNFMVKEIEKKYNKKYPVTKIDFLSHFYPPYTKYIVDVVQRFCSNPIVSIGVPQVMDLLTYEVALQNKSFGIRDLTYHNIGDIHVFLKSVKDIITFGERTEILSKDDVKKIKSFLSEIQ